MKFFWHIAPLTRLIIPLILGVVLAIHYFPYLPQIKYLLLFQVFFAYYIFKYSKFFRKYKYRLYSGIAFNILLFTMGVALLQLHRTIERENHFENIDPEGNFLIKISSNMQEKTGSFKAEGEVIARKGKELQQTSGRVLLYLEKESVSDLKIGDIILANVNFQKVEPPHNPNQFNYRKYLSYRQIAFQAYLPTGQYELYKKGNDANILRYFEDIRNELISKFDDFDFSKDQKAVASALILGNKDYLNPELTHSYASAGAMHVLAVSGLHVGIVYLILSYLFSFLNKREYRHYKLIIMIVLLWTYAVLTGLSPSVLRATVMFTFISWAKNSGRFTNIYNVLAGSAIVLIILNPFIVMEVGFQLSYLAVLGIVYLQPKIYSIVVPNNWLLNKIWELTAVSIAAQIATFPLGLLYFHQFPTLFLFSNLLVIPAATFVLYAGIPFLVLSWIPYLSDILAFFLKFIISFLNYGVKITEGLPFSLISGISISVFESYLIFILIFLIALFLSKPSKQTLRLTYITVFFICSFQTYEAFIQKRQKMIVVYHINKHTAVDFIHGREHCFLGDSALYYNKNSLRFNISNNWDFLGLKKEHYLDLQQDTICKVEERLCRINSLIQFENTLLFIAQSSDQLSLIKAGEVDIILLKDFNTYSIQVNEYDENCLLIVDGSTPEYKIKYIKEKIKTPNLIATRKGGAFIYALNQ